MEGGKCLLVLLLSLLVPALSQVYPTEYVMETAATSINGSQVTGHCSCTSQEPSTRNCRDPTSSVLFDGHIPTLTGLDGDTWASQLLTIQDGESEITFDFTATPGYARVERVELVLFNCPQWEIEVQTIIVLGAAGVNAEKSSIVVHNIQLTSCDSLIQVCIPVQTTNPVISLRFHLANSMKWLHLAEVRFFGGSAECPANKILSLPTTAMPRTTEKGMEVDRNSATPTTDYTSDQTSDCIPCQECPSCSTATLQASVIATIVTALLATAIFALVQVIVCRHFLHKIDRERTTHLDTHDQIRREERADIEMEDHTYMEVANGISAIEVKENEAYASHSTGNGLRHTSGNGMGYAPRGAIVDVSANGMGHAPRSASLGHVSSNGVGHVLGNGVGHDIVSGNGVGHVSGNDMSNGVGRMSSLSSLTSTPSSWNFPPPDLASVPEIGQPSEPAPPLQRYLTNTK